MTRVRRWAPWTLLLVVAAVVLAVGLHRSDHPSLNAQVMHIAGEVRCPVCNGETVAESNAAVSVDIRNQIRTELLAHQTPNQIVAGLVQSYGTGILERPQPQGLGLLIWILPVVAAVGGVTALGFMFSRWRKNTAPPPSADRRDEPWPAAEAGWPAPHAVLPVPHAVLPVAPVPTGGPSGVGPAVLVAPAQTPPSARAVEPDVAAETLKSPRNYGRWAVMAAGIAFITAGACWALVAATTTRLPGQAVTGQALGPERVAADLQAAQQDATSGNVVSAIKQYQKVLQSDPTQLEALASEGWLLAQTGQPALLQQGITLLTSAEKVDPTYAPAHVYRGLAYLSEDDYWDSIGEFKWYLAHGPDPQLAPRVRAALAQAEKATAPKEPTK